MKFYKPKFWDYKKPNLFAYLLLPLTFPILINNLLRNIVKPKKISNVTKICIGNIYIGGTGKTPLAIRLNNLLNYENVKSVIIKKFYKNQIDEQKLIKKHSNLILNKYRLNALKEAEENKFNYAIFDDGLQDKSINYDLKIVCFNNLQWIGNGFLIPAGPLREKVKSVQKYDAVVLNGDPSLNKFNYAIFDDGLQDKSINYDLKIVCFNNLQWIGNGFLIPAGPLREKVKSVQKYDAVVLNGDPNLNKFIIEKLKEINKNLKIFEISYTISNLEKFNKNFNYVIFSGIANSGNFLKILKQNNFKINKEFVYPDHHTYSNNELEKIINYAKENNAKIITTEKDYYKLDQKYLNEIMFLKLDLKIHNQNNFLKFIKSKNENN